MPSASRHKVKTCLPILAIAAILALPALYACGGGGAAGSGNGSLPAPPAALALGLQMVASGLSAPTFSSAPIGDARLFIVERAGRIRIVQNGVLASLPFLDIARLTTTDGERGLLSMAFDPRYAVNGFFYVYYTDLSGNISVARFTVPAATPNTADPLSRLALLTIPHPTYSNHNGGLLAFGPDGMLYVGTGDGGGAGDPFSNAQDTGSLLGKLLRLDVSAASAQAPYAIAPSNPFVGSAGKRPEIWAYGLRNPWRFAFDTLGNKLYIADVGQDAVEEVDIAELDSGGRNYGWNLMEGGQCYGATSCNQQGLTLPVLQYIHSGGACAITGGYVYRGQALPELAGRYFYADLCTGSLKSFFYVNGAATENTTWNIPDITPIYSFGLDGQNELYLVSGNGSVYRLVRQ